MNDSSGVAGTPISARLLLGQSVQTGVEHAAVLTEERLELDAGRLIDDVFGEGGGEGRHV